MSAEDVKIGNPMQPMELWKQWLDTTTEFLRKLAEMGADPGGLTTRWLKMMEDARATILAGESLPAEPFTFFKQWYDATSETWSRMMEDIIGSEKFVEAASQFLESYASSYRIFRRANEEFFGNLQLPTRSDLARVAELVVNLEDKVDHIEDTLEDFEDGYSQLATSAAIGNVVRRLDQLESKLEKLLATLEKIEAAASLAQRLDRVESKNEMSQSSALSDFESAFKKYRTGMQIMLEGAKIETGQTPKEVIWTKNKAKLYHYEPMVEERYPVPILLIYALINRSYVLDLMPGNSLVEYLLGKGFDVYMLDWGIPGDEDKNLTFENYVLDYIPQAIKKMLRNSNANEFTLLGYCMGGTMSAMYAALFPDKPLRNLILLTTPIDFTRDKIGLYGIWTSERYFNPDSIVEAFGNVPGELIDIANRMAKPVTNYVGSFVTMWDRIIQGKSMDTWLAMNKWVNDGIPFPGEVFRQWMRDFYQKNKLVKGEIKLRGRRVDLSNITCPVLSIAGKKDHICTLPQAEATMSLIGSEDKEFFVLDAGHVGLLTGSGAREGLWPKLCSWLELRSK